MRHVCVGVFVASFLLASGVARATSVRELTLPAGATIATEAGRAAVTANARGDVTALVSLGPRKRIVVWDVTGHRRTLAPPRGEAYDDAKTASTQDGVVAPNGTVYGVAAYPFSGAYSGTRTRLYAWGSGDPLRIDGRPCSSGASDLHPTAVAADGRVALAGGYDSAVMNIDALKAGGMSPTASVLDGAACHVLDFGWISALDGRFAAGHRGYQNGKPFSPNANAQSQRYVAVRWTGTHAQEIGPGVALGVNAKGDCVKSDAPPGIVGSYATSVTTASGTVSHVYAIGDMHARLWRGGTTVRLSPSARRSIAYGINETGRTVVGTVYDSTGQHAVRWRDGKEEPLDAFLAHDSGWHLNVAYGVTPDGAIFGVGVHAGTMAAFVLSVTSARP